MKSGKTCLTALVAGLALTTAISTGFAQDRSTLLRDPDRVGAARAQALRTCTALEEQYREHSWGIQEAQIYRACMAQHGQPE
jgi:hypothetical protein